MSTSGPQAAGYFGSSQIVLVSSRGRGIRQRCHRATTSPALSTSLLAQLSPASVEATAGQAAAERRGPGISSTVMSVTEIKTATPLCWGLERSSRRSCGRGATRERGRSRRLDRRLRPLGQQGRHPPSQTRRTQPDFALVSMGTILRARQHSRRSPRPT